MLRVVSKTRNESDEPVKRNERGFYYFINKLIDFTNIFLGNISTV